MVTLGWVEIWPRQLHARTTCTSSHIPIPDFHLHHSLWSSWLNHILHFTLFCLLITSLLTLWESHIIHTNSIHLPVLCPPFIPAIPSHIDKETKQTIKQIKAKAKKKPKNKKKNKNQQQKQNKIHKNRKISLLLLPSCLFNSFSGNNGSFSVPCNTSCCPISFTVKSSLQWITGLVQGLWFLVRHHYWIRIRTPLGYSVAATSLGDLAGSVPQDQSLTRSSQS